MFTLLNSTYLANVAEVWRQQFATNIRSYKPQAHKDTQKFIKVRFNHRYFTFTLQFLVILRNVA
jgi:hypothetical protein